MTTRNISEKRRTIKDFRYLVVYSRRAYSRVATTPLCCFNRFSAHRACCSVRPSFANSEEEVCLRVPPQAHPRPSHHGLRPYQWPRTGPHGLASLHPAAGDARRPHHQSPTRVLRPKSWTHATSCDTTARRQCSQEGVVGRRQREKRRCQPRLWKPHRHSGGGRGRRRKKIDGAERGKMRRFAVCERGKFGPQRAGRWGCSWIGRAAWDAPIALFWL